jgi:hypothetical protein
MKPKPSALRPSFTKKIANYLHNGFKVNVYSSETQGLRQLIDDLEQNCPSDVKFLRINMRSHVHSFTSYLLALSDALKLPNPEQYNLRSALLEYLDQHPGQKLQLCLENFDQLCEERVGDQAVDKLGYNLDFLTHLNSFGNNPRIALLFSSTRKLDTRELYIGGTRVSGSRIDVKHQELLPRLNFTEIENHLLHLVPDEVATVLQEKPPFYTLLITHIANHPDPADFMGFIASSIPADAGLSNADFEQYLAHWQQEYKMQQRFSTDLRLNKFGRWVKHQLRRLLRLVGISKDLSTAAKIIRGLVTVGLVSIPFWEKVQQLWSWVFSLFAK